MRCFVAQGSASNTSAAIKWKIGLTFPEAHGTPLAGEIHDERWIIGFAERFYHAEQEFVIRKAAALVRAALEPDAEQIHRN